VINTLLYLAAEDSSTSISGKSAVGIVVIALLLIWAGSKGGRGR